MKKFLLVVFIGLVLGINLVAIVETIKDYYNEEEVVEDYKGYTVVYEE